MRIIDAHVHLSDFKREEIEDFIHEGYILVAVAEDYESSLKTLELRDLFPENIKACVGLHPWKTREQLNLESELEKVLDLVRDADCIGEVGLDKKFVPENTLHDQLRIFNQFVDAATKFGKPLNIHSAGAWGEVLDVLREKKAERVVLHWWTGPINLLKEIIQSGYYVTINASIKIQEKSRRIAEELPLNLILTESDGPYNYRGLYLNPKLLPETLQILSQIKNVPVEDIKNKVWQNFLNLFSANRA